MKFDFTGKVVIVVGGTSGINRGIAEHFAATGAKVAVASRSQEKVDDTVASLKQKGAADVMGFVCDVRNPDEVEEGLAKVHQAWGDFDSLVSGAAGNFPALASKMSANAFRTVVDIDLMGTYHVMRSAYPFMKRPGSSVINISAPQAYLPYEAQSHVCAAKAGVDMLTRTTAMEWGSEGIRVNSVVPGAIDGTEGMKRLAPTEPIRQMILEDTPMQRFGTPADVANLCLFLNSELATFISGQIIAVDGALYQRGSGTFNRKLAEPLYKM